MVLTVFCPGLQSGLAASVLICSVASDSLRPVDWSPPGSSVHGILHGQEYWSRLPFPTPGDLPDPGIEPASPALAGRFFTPVLPGKWLCPTPP